MACKRAWLVVLLGLTGPLAAAQEDYLPAADLDRVGLLKMWQLPLPLERDQHLADLYLVDDALYATTTDGYVYALDAPTGAVRWMRRITSEGYRVWRPCHSGERVIFATPTTVLQLNRWTGEGVHRMVLDFPCGTAPVCDGPRFFVGGLDRRLYAFEVQNPLRSWRVVTNGPIQSAPAVYKERVFFASNDGSVYSCLARNKSAPWQNYTYGTISADLVVNESGVFVACRDQSLYLFDRSYGQVRWRARFSGPLYEPPVVTDDTAYQYCPDDGLVAVNTEVVGLDKRLRWTLPRGRMLLTRDDRRAFVLSRDDSLLVVNDATGTILDTVPAGGLALGAPQTRQTALYLGAPDGRLFCARPKGTPPVRAEDVRAALARRGAKPEEPAAEAAQVPVPGVTEPGGLGTSRTGPPIGGKSKVSKNFGKGGGSGTPQP